MPDDQNIAPVFHQKSVYRVKSKYEVCNRMCTPQTHTINYHTQFAPKNKFQHVFFFRVWIMKYVTMSSIKTMTNSEKRIRALGKILHGGFYSWSLVIVVVLCTLHSQYAHAFNRTLCTTFRYGIVGILTGLVACTVDIVIEKISALKYGFLKICKYRVL